MSGAAGRATPLDGPLARIVAAGVVLAGFAFLAWVFRGALFPPDPAAAPDNPAEAAYHACVEPRAAQFKAARERGELSEEQTALFRRRAEAFCADQARRGRLRAGPSVPGQ